MSVEIKEIIIRAIVEEGKSNAPLSSDNYTELLMESAEQALKIIEKKKER